jgi:S-DNA-T family DNA segregation ATPase FtsK/SpoIIIE
MTRKTRPKKESRDRGAAPPRRKSGTPLQWYWRYSLVLALIGVAALLWMSLLTYSPDDLSWPAPNAQPGALTASMPRPDTPMAASQPRSAPAKREIRNAVGIVGAHTANALLHYVGGGVYAAVLLASLAALLLALQGNVAMFGLRVLGAVLLVAAISCAIYLLHASRVDSANVGPAGVLGVRTGQFLQARFALSGAWTIVIVVVGIASVLTAGRLLITAPARTIACWRAWRQAVAKRLAAEQRACLQHNEAGPTAQSAGEASGAEGEPLPTSPGAPDDSHVRLLEHIRQELRTRLPDRKPNNEGERTSPLLLPGEPPLPREWAAHDLPSPDLLAKPDMPDSSTPAAEGASHEGDEPPATRRRQALEQALTGFGISAQVVGQQEGPSLTMFELALAPGVKVAEVSNLAADLARSLSVAGVRVVSPLPRRDTVGLEVPRADRQAVYLRELMESSPVAAEGMALPLYLGKDAVGMPIVTDLAEMPHMLIAGTTGSGKSVCINSIILGLTLTRRPSQVRMVMVDPKMVELATFEDIPHLLCPVISDMARAAEVLAWAAARMDDRYRLLKRAKVRNIADFNRLDQAELRKRLGFPEDPRGDCQPLGLPYIVVIVDELADLVMTAGKEVQTHIVRIAQKARAVGIHLVLATQRPSVDVVTGLIKSNVSCRLSFQVASRLESRIVLDQNGAEVLLGKGDMLLLLPGAAKVTRGQGTFVHDTEIRAVVAELTKWGAPRFSPELAGEAAGGEPEPSHHLDDLFEQAVEVVLEARRGTALLLQRRLQLPSARAGMIIDQMVQVGILGESKGFRGRQCVIALDEWRRLLADMGRSPSGGALA